MERPQRVRLRRALFQIHLWTGIAAGIYVLAVSVSGSAIVFRRELEKRAPRIIDARGRAPLSAEQFQQRVRQAYPSGELLSIVPQRRPDQPYAVVLSHGGRRVERRFDPYTGADLGDDRRWMDRVLDWLTDLHDNLLAGVTGRMLNGLGAFLLVLMSATGGVIWWPGVKNWRRSTRVSWKARPARLNWDLHSAVGFWCYLFVLTWGISGFCLCFPGTLDFLFGFHVRYWLTNLHFGRFNLVTETMWTIAGLAPAFLAVTGALMWWNRVLSKKFRRPRDRKADAVTV